MAKVWKRLQNQVAGRAQKYSRTAPDRVYAKELFGVLYELNMFHVKQLQVSIEALGREPTQDELGFFESCAEYRRQLELLLEANK